MLNNQKMVCFVSEMGGKAAIETLKDASHKGEKFLPIDVPHIRTEKNIETIKRCVMKGIDESYDFPNSSGESKNFDSITNFIFDTVDMITREFSCEAGGKTLVVILMNEFLASGFHVDEDKTGTGQVRLGVSLLGPATEFRVAEQQAQVGEGYVWRRDNAVHSSPNGPEGVDHPMRFSFIFDTKISQEAAKTTQKRLQQIADNTAIKALPFIKEMITLVESISAEAQDNAMSKIEAILRNKGSSDANDEILAERVNKVGYKKSSASLER